MSADVAFGRRRATRLLVLAAVCVVLLAAVYLVAVHTAWGQRIDDAALDGRTTRAGVQHATTRLLDTISVSSLVLGTGAVVVVALARHRPHLALTAVVVVLGANVSTQLLKKVILDRPDLGVHEDAHEMSNWFPSGHATVAMSLAVALVLVVSVNVRPWAALGGLAYATLVGAGTVTAGWHRPSDVTGAYLVVTAWAAGSVAALVWAEGAERARPSALVQRVPTLSPFLAGLGIGVLLGAMFGVAGTLVAARTEQLDAVQLGGAYAAAIAVIAGSALVLLLAVLGALRGVSLDPPHLHRTVASAAPEAARA